MYIFLARILKNFKNKMKKILVICEIVFFITNIYFMEDLRRTIIYPYLKYSTIAR